MVRFFKRKRKRKKDIPTPEPSTQEFIGRIFDEMRENGKIIASADQKITEKEGKLRGVVELTDLNKENLRSRVNSMHELLGEEIDAINDEINAVRKVLSDIQKTNYDKIYARAKKQDRHDPDVFDTLLTNPDKETENLRRELAEDLNKHIGEYKSSVNSHNDEVTALKELLSNSDEKLIESEKNHVNELINMLSSQLESLNTAKKNLENKPNLSQARAIRQSILSSLAKFDARTNSAALERIRKENDKVEQDLNDMFIEEQKINSLDMQIRKVGEKINQVSSELTAKSELHLGTLEVS